MRAATRLAFAAYLLALGLFYAPVAASVYACLGPGKSEYLSLKGVATPYYANFSEPNCAGL